MDKTRIVILGGGFGGIYTAMYLEKLLKKRLDIEVTLVNRENYFVYQPMLAEVVSGAVGILETISSVRSLLPKTRLYFREIESINLEKKEIILTPQFTHTPDYVYYDHLVISLGNVTDFHTNPGLHEHAMAFKNLADSLLIRNRVIDAIETAANLPDDAVKKQILTFVVGGGGFSGTEVVAEVNDFARKLAKDYPTIKQSDIRVVLVHSKDRLMDRELSPSLGVYAGEILQKRGVEIRFNMHLKTATPEEAILETGERIPSKTIISTVPSSPNPLIQTLNLANIKGKLKVDLGLLVDGQTNIWALGDCAMVPQAEKEGFCPLTAQFAIREAKVLAHNIVATIDGKKKKTFKFEALGMLGALGHHSAVAQLFGKLKFSGIIAWMLWRMIYWMKLPGFGRKVKVGFSWLLDAMIPVEPVQLKITPTQGIGQLHFKEGEIIFHENDFGDFLYIIIEGKVEIFKTVDSKEQGICTLSKGEFFGEMALLNQKSRSATVRCLSSVDVIALRKQDFGLLIANFYDLRSSFEKTTKERGESPS